MEAEAASEQSLIPGMYILKVIRIEDTCVNKKALAKVQSVLRRYLKGGGIRRAVRLECTERLKTWHPHGESNPGLQDENLAS